MTVQVIMDHWTHKKFAENLLNASRARDLTQAAQEWQYEGMFDSIWFRAIGGVLTDELRCQCCNTHIKNYVILGNRVNGNKLLIGHKCYDKLLVFLGSGQIRSALPDRKNQIKEARTYWKNNVPDRTFLGWFEEQSSLNLLPKRISELYSLVIRLGYAPTTLQADELVEYYKSKRKFPTEKLLGKKFSGFAHKKLLPGFITICESKRIEELLERQIKYQQRLAQNKVSDETWKYYRSEAIRTADSITLCIKRAKEHEIVFKNEEQIREFLKVAQKIRSLPETRPSDFNNLKVRRQFASILGEWREWAIPYFASQEKALLLPPTSDQKPPYLSRTFLVKKGYKWKTCKFSEIYEGELPQQTNPTLFLVRKFILENREQIAIDKKLECDFPQIDFRVKSNKFTGEFIGFYQNKLVSATPGVTKPGTYMVYLTESFGTYLNAWVIGPKP